MKKSETTMIVAKLMTVYPSFKFGVNPLTGEEASLLEVVNIWHDLIGDMEYAGAEKAVNTCINKCKFVPSVAEIREEYTTAIEEINAKDRAVRDAYRNITNVYTDSGKLDHYLPVFRERCGNDPAVASRLRNALERFSDTKYQWLPNLGQAIMCIDIDAQTIPDEMMELVQEYKNQMLPDDVMRKWSKMPPSKPVDERKNVRR